MCSQKLLGIQHLQCGYRWLYFEEELESFDCVPERLYAKAIIICHFYGGMLLTERSGWDEDIVLKLVSIFNYNDLCKLMFFII
jgi:hypothetical protein